MPSISRRGLIGKAALIGGTILLASSEEALAATVAVPAALGDKSGKDYLPTFSYEPKPLPFKENELRAFSYGSLAEHHADEYCQAIKRLEGLQAAIAKLPPHTPPYLLGALKREELTTYNDIVLHELYFASLAGDGKPDKSAEAMLKKSFGSFKVWRDNFTAVAKSLGGGAGWCAVNYSSIDGRLHNVFLGDSQPNMVAGIPLLVLDLYQHAYADQFGEVSSYIDAFLDDANWSNAGNRLAGFGFA